jgi:pectate lyase
MNLPRVLPLLSLILAATLGSLAAEPAPLPAFPGAEGFGADTPGGRGGRVLFVTNLDDAGPGSLRAACEAEGPRTVIFRVSGTIALKSDIVVKNPFLTIAGQTATGDGICLRDATLGVATHDVIIRYLRCRLGDESKRESDSLDLWHGAKNVIFDHCSATWSVDECLSLSGNVSHVTVQWSLIGEALRGSLHSKGAHGYGSLARANGPVSFHHNLWIHNDSRNPRLGDNYGRGPTFPTFDVRNNVIYNFGSVASGLTQGILKVNYVGNYLRAGPTSTARTPITVAENSDLQFFIRDNVYDAHDDFTADNTRFFSLRETAAGKRVVTLVDQPFAAPAVSTTSAAEALELVLANVGASLPKRDAVDARLINHVRTRTGSMINSQKEVGGWPELKSGPVPADGDDDGMPDEWETTHRLDAGDPADTALDADKDGYTNLEEYLNGTDPRKGVDPRRA